MDDGDGAVGECAEPVKTCSSLRGWLSQCHSNFLYGDTSALAALAWMAL